MKPVWILNVDMLLWSMKLQETAQGVILDVHVKPKSKLFQLKMEVMNWWFRAVKLR